MCRAAVRCLVRGGAVGLVLSCVGLGLPGLGPMAAQADRIRLRGGGEIRGAIRTDPERPDVLLVQTLNGSSPIAFPREDIVQVIEEQDVLDEYDARRAALPETAADHYQFGLWCEENRLSGLAEVHYRRAVELDKDFGPAHKKLGHVEHDGAWVTYDELRAAQGLVKHEGQWISRQEYEQIEARRAGRAELEVWVRQVRVLRAALGSASGTERVDAERRLGELRDPVVVPALVEVLGKDPDPSVRELLVRLLGAIDGPAALHALIGRALAEADESIRREAVAALVWRDDPEAAQALIGLLKSRDRQVVSRAASALAGLGAIEAVPRLIDVLVQVERRPVLVPTMQPAAAPAPISGMSAVTGRSIPVVTGPVVGPGAIAYGATSVPYASGVGLHMGSGGMQPGPPEVRILTRVDRNPDVLAALEILTGQNFGYNKASWKRWLATSFRRQEVPARRVPQP